MYLFYVDESGAHDAWTAQDNFVLGGVAVHESQVRNYSLALDAIQAKHFPAIGIPVEFHAQHIQSGKGRYRQFTTGQRAALINDLGDVVSHARFPSMVCFISAIHVSRVASPSQALKDCLEDLLERFNNFLVRQFRQGFKDKGLVIIDASGRDAQIRDIMGEFDRKGTTHGFLGNIVDVPHFADSAHTRMLQIADMVAYAGGRYFNSSDRKLLDMVLPRIDRASANGRRTGLKHLVDRTKHDCPCIACSGIVSDSAGSSLVSEPEDPWGAQGLDHD